MLFKSPHFFIFDTTDDSVGMIRMNAQVGGFLLTFGCLGRTLQVALSKLLHFIKYDYLMSLYIKHLTTTSELHLFSILFLFV